MLSSETITVEIHLNGNQFKATGHPSEVALRQASFQTAARMAAASSAPDAVREALLASERLCDELARILWSTEPWKWPEIRDLRNDARAKLSRVNAPAAPAPKEPNDA